MRTLGVIVRADQGGLANQTWEIWRHMRPDRTLVVCAGGGARGDERPDRYDGPGVTVHDGLTLDPRTLAGWADGLDVVFTVETPYCRHGFDVLRDVGVRTVLLANPELFRLLDHGPPDVLRVPTDWHLDRLRRARVLPQPVALDRFEHRRRTEGRVLYHPAAPAMRDRNGTEALLAALPFVTEPVTVRIRGVRVSGSRRIGRCRVEWLPHHRGDYWEALPPDTDVLVLPRRYGGLSLSVLEAAAAGVPAIMPALTPQVSWPGVETVPVSGHTLCAMKGGAFPVHEVDPHDLADAIDRLAREPDRVARLSDAARGWAESLSWESQLPAWVGTLR